MKYCYYLDAKGKEVMHGPAEEFSSGVHLIASLNYANGKLDGQARYYGRDGSSGDTNYYLGKEGSYSAGLEVGLWKYYFVSSYGVGVESLGKLEAEGVWGLTDDGRAWPSEERYYCGYGPAYVHESKRGKLARITTTNLSTGVRTEQLIFKNGCSTTPG